MANRIWQPIDWLHCSRLKQSSSTMNPFRRLLNNNKTNYSLPSPEDTTENGAPRVEKQPMPTNGHHHQLDHHHHQHHHQSRSGSTTNVSLAPYVDGVLSYAYGRSRKELKYGTIGPVLDSMAQGEQAHSLAVAVHDEDIAKSFKDFNADVDGLVNGMVLKLDLKRGDKVGLYSYNNYQFLLVQLACNKLGLVFNPINPSYKSHEFNYVLERTDVKVLFAPGSGSKQLPLNDHWSVLCHESLVEIRTRGSIASLVNIVILDGDSSMPGRFALQGVKIHEWKDIIIQASSTSGSDKKLVAERLGVVRSDDIHGIYYTSGTTGFPKGATITQFNVLNNATLACERLFDQRGPKFDSIRPNVCMPLPLFHEFAGVLGVLLPFVSVGGGSIVLPGLRYNIRVLVESIMKFECNSIFLTPTILIDLIGHIESSKLTRVPLRSLLIGGSTVSPELIHKARKVLPHLEEIRIGYGCSENGVIVCIQTGLEPSESAPHTVGSPLDFTEIRIVDSATGEITPIGQPGEVQTRGFNTMLGYYNDPDRTNEVITPTRWYRTGDLGTIDKLGSLKIVGRIKDLIIKGGENIYPAEVETILHTHDGVEDAHAFGVPDKRFGEEVCVWIKLVDGDGGNSGLRGKSEDEMRREIIGFCKQRLTYFKAPKYVQFVESFPLTPVKKIKKYEMRAKMIEMLKLDE